MNIRTLTLAECELPDYAETTVERWLARGDGLAVYENKDFGHPQFGHRQFVSYGSADAQLEVPTPPVRMPDIGNQINWRYRLVGVHGGPADERQETDWEQIPRGRHAQQADEYDAARRQSFADTLGVDPEQLP